MRIVEVGDNTIYGEWSDTGGTQTMVQYTDNGIYCIVFFLSGMDYGGGIYSIYDNVRTNDCPVLSVARRDMDESDFADKLLEELKAAGYNARSFA